MEPNAAEPVFHAVPEPAEPHLELLPGLEPIADAPEPEAVAEVEVEPSASSPGARTRATRQPSGS